MALTPKYLDHVPDNMVRLFADAEEKILKDMARRIKTYDYFIPAAQHQYKQAREMGMMHDEIMDRLSQITKKTSAELESLMYDAGAETIKSADRIHKAAGKVLPPLKASPVMRATLNAGLVNTKNLFINLTRTTAVNAGKQFADVLDIIHLQVTTGAFDVDSAIRNGIKEISKRGLTAVKYPSGRTESIEVAVRRATLTGVNQTCGKLQEARADEAGCELVEVTAHAGARAEHAAWQGKIYALHGSTKKYPNLVEATDYGTGAGLCGWNCRHSFFPFYEGLSVPAYDREQLREYEAKRYAYKGNKMTEYEARQRQRYLERGVRRWKREFVLAENAGIETSEAASKLAQWRMAYNTYLRETGFKPDAGRTLIAGFDRGLAQKSVDKVVVTDKMVVEKAEFLRMDYAPFMKGQISSKNARQWYVKHSNVIPVKVVGIDRPEDRAKQAFDLRNKYRFQAREMMKDLKTRRQLDHDDPINRDFEQFLKAKMSQYRCSRAEAIDKIVGSAAKTRKSVNDKFGL